VTFGAPELGEALIQACSLFCAATGSVLGFWAGARRHARRLDVGAPRRVGFALSCSARTC
jgi:hypothetical protein